MPITPCIHHSSYLLFQIKHIALLRKLSDNIRQKSIFKSVKYTRFVSECLVFDCLPGQALNSRDNVDSCLDANTSATRVSYRLAWQRGQKTAQHIIRKVRMLYFFVPQQYIHTILLLEATSKVYLMSHLWSRGKVNRNFITKIKSSVPEPWQHTTEVEAITTYDTLPGNEFEVITHDKAVFIL